MIENSIFFDSSFLETDTDTDGQSNIDTYSCAWMYTEKEVIQFNEETLWTGGNPDGLARGDQVTAHRGQSTPPTD